MLAGDLARARHRVVIYSPFLTDNRLGQLQPQLQAAASRGVAVYVVADWGVLVVHKRNMHEKLVFVDDQILWSGSLNPLSFSDTQEVMERRRNHAVVDDFAKTLRLDDLVGEYGGGPPACPICGSEVVACEGKDEPYFWRCVEDHCYSRSIDAPRLTGGMVSCANCGGPVEFGQWGDEYKWRCTDNSRHRQSIARTHLRLPGMRALVPKPTLRQLDRQFGLDPTTGRPQSSVQPGVGQLNLEY